MTPDGWTTRPLIDLCDRITDGSHFSPTPVEDGVPIATVANMRSRDIDVDSCAQISENDFESLERNGCRPQADDVLFSKDGSVGKVLVVQADSRLVLLSSIAILRPNKDRIASSFLGQSLKWSRNLRILHGMRTGTAIRRVVLRDLRRLRLAVPPLVEQRNIAAILSSVDDVIDKTQTVIDQVQILKRGVMQELLTRGLPGRHTQFKETRVGDVPACWRLVALGEVLEAIEAGWSPKCEARQAEMSEWGVLKVSSTSSGRFRQHENKALLDQLEPRPALEVKDGDVLVARASGVLELVGRSAFVHRTRRRLMLSDKTLRLQVKKSVIRPLFLHLVLGDIGVRRQILIRTTGSHMRNVSQRALRSVPIPVPTLEEQERIEVLERHASARLEKEAESLRQLEEVKSALMSVLLTGELRVTPDPEPE